MADLPSDYTAWVEATVAAPEPEPESNAALWTYYRPRAAELTRKREARRSRSR